jgi:predicted Ser/Thr protein kinase
MPAGPVPSGTDVPIVSGYELLEELGRGGMGVVYKGRHTRLDRFVAVKVLPAEASRESAFAERFIREARALARLSHPSIITVYDFGQEGDRSYFIMEYVDGTNLRQRLRNGPLPPHEALQIAAQVCEALQYAHDEGIVHRDIKPENILLDKRSRVKIADFGIVKLLTRKTQEYTLTGPWQVVGTLNYMAPEQIENPLALDHRADIYSVGVVLYEMLTGQLPRGRFPLPSAKAGLDTGVDAVVLRALEAAPELRYRTADEMKAALQAAGVQEPPGTKAGAPAPAPAATTTAPLVARKFPDAALASVRRRLRGPADLLLLAGGLNGLLAFILGIFGIAMAVPPHADHMQALLILPALGELLLGGLLIWGAVEMFRVGRYRVALLGSVLAMLPLSPIWPISVWQGYLALTALARPDVQAAFGAQRIPTASRGPAKRPGRLRRFSGSITGWAIVLSFLGLIACLQPIWPWAQLVVVDNSGTAHPVADVRGYDGWLGLAAAVAFFCLLIFLIATSSLDPVPWWQAASVIVAGLVASVTTANCLLRPGDPTINSATVTSAQDNAGFLSWGGSATVKVAVFEKVEREVTLAASTNNSMKDSAADVRTAGSSFQVRLPQDAARLPDHLLATVRVRIGAALYAAQLLGLGLLVLGTVQLRGILMRRQKTHS